MLVGLFGGNSIETGLARYEFGVYKVDERFFNGRLEKVFRTDTDFVLKVIESEARKCAQRLHDERGGDYEVRQIKRKTY